MLGNLQTKFAIINQCTLFKMEKRIFRSKDQSPIDQKINYVENFVAKRESTCFLWHSLKSGLETRDPGRCDLDPGTMELGPWACDPGTWVPDTWDPGNGILRP